MTKRIFCLLLMAALLAVSLPNAAFAGASMGLSVSTPYPTISGYLKFSWSKVSNAQFYAYSVRDTTTNTLYANLVQTSKTSVSLYGQYDAGHSFRVWVGACCPGNDPNNTSTWDYTDMTTVTIPADTHKYTESAWDTSYSVTYKSISDTQHQITGYQYDYCTYCFKKIGSSYKVTETESHSFKSNGDCKLCDYTAACKHSSKILVVMDGYPIYKYKNETQHTVYTYYNRVCKTCGEIITKDVTSAREVEYEKHSFNSKGVCTQCGYQKTTEALKVSVSAGQSKVNAGEYITAGATASGGTGTYKYAWSVSQNGTKIYETDTSYGKSFSYKTSAAGTYKLSCTVIDSAGTSVTSSSGNITVEAVCTHPATEWRWDTKGEYKSISDTKHSMTGTQKEYCTVCGTATGNTKTATQEGEHDLSRSHSNGICTVCGYQCKHPVQEFAWDKWTNVESISDTQHRLTGIGHKYCTTCFVVTVSSYSYSETTSHVFDSAGDCTICNYRHSCQHTETRLVIASGYPAYSQYNSAQHKITSVYNEICANASCQKTVKLSAKTDISYADHTFDSNGVCKFCGYTKPSEQKKLSVSVSVSPSSATTDQTITATASASGGDGNYRYSWLITLNGSEINRIEYGKQSWMTSGGKVGKYVFTVTVKDGNGNTASASSRTVTVTQAECSHPSTTKVVSDTSYTQYSDAVHMRVDTISNICNSCGQEVSSHIESQPQAHTFSSGSCIYCGLKEPTECTHRNYTEQLVDKYISGKGDANRHVVTCVYKTVCSDCHETISTRESKVMEYHSFDKNGVCACGYAKPSDTCDHADTKQTAVKEPSYEIISDIAHKKITVVDITCANCGLLIESGKTVSVTEGHTYVNGVCACGEKQNSEKDEPEQDKPKTLGLSAKVPNVGSNVPINISWNAVGAKYYAYSIRNMTTNVQYYDRVKTENAGATINGAFLDGQQYRIWVGGYCDGDDPYNTSTWTYQDSVVITVAAHVHKFILQTLPESEHIANQGHRQYSLCECGYAEYTGVYLCMKYCADCALEGIHTYTKSTDQLKAKHYEGLGHKYFDVCNCGLTRETGEYGKLDSCCDCYGHQWSESYEENGKWYRKCIRSTTCREVEGIPDYSEVISHLQIHIAPPAIDGCAKFGEHKWSIKYAKEHPHTAYWACECGSTAELPAYYAKSIKLFDCCECLGTHDFSEPIRLPNGTYVIGCYRCNKQVTVNPPANVVEFNAVLDQMNEVSVNAKNYTVKSGSYKSSQSAWKTVAGQATDQLTDMGFVFTTVALDNLSDASGTLVDEFVESGKNLVSGSEWDRQQQTLWDEALRRMLTGRLESENTGIGGSWEDWTDFIDKGDGIAKDVLLDTLKEISETQVALYKSTDVDSMKIFDELEAKYQSGSKTLSAAEGLGYILDFVDIAADLIDKKTEADNRKNSLLNMLYNYDECMKILDEIYANTSDENLRVAAAKLKNDLDTQRNDKVKAFAKESGSIVVDCVEVYTEKVAGKAIDEAFDMAAPYLKVVELVASGGKLVLNWEASYNAAYELMTVSTMDATLNVLDSVKDTEYFGELWGYIQIMGDERAETFLQEWENANFKSTEDFGITLDEALDKLDKEQKSYEEFVQRQR